MAATNPLSPSPSLSKLNPETVAKAANALLKWVKSKAKNQKAQLLDHDELIYLVLTLKKIPPKARTNPYKIPLPHPIFQSPSLEICLIFDDRPNSSLTSDAAKKKIKSESIPVSKVLKLSKLRSDYRPFEAKRKLCGSYDLFFADKRVIPLLPKLLGKQFYKKKRLPIPIDLSHKNWKEQIENACSSSLLYLRTGTCCIMKVGLVSQERDEIVENVVAAVNGAVEIVPKKWGNVRSLHLKALESVALPIYQAVPEMGLKIEGFKKEDREKKAGLEHGVGEEEEKEKKKKKVVKKGRIHEVRYMDSHAEELMANMADDDSEAEANGNEELGVLEVKENKLKKKNKKTMKMAGGEGEANEADELGGVKTTDKMKMAKKKKAVTVKSPKKSAPIVDDSDSKAKEMGKKMAKKKVLESMLSQKTAKLVEDGSVELENGSSGAEVVDNKMKKRRKAEVAEGKEKKTKKK
ncbi:Ribosomal protein L1 [Cinnamomum micranthum f. kanehirae]|uniref:Ribosomal protein L1 n=1 Tax=Cinnamomum micranthum f. kanehirae TaxID=337451 RepID=A0A3S3MTT5_9MAGN|nr:Ribosomal protein L1 [Cinnamomum micranthum f. kanehirae]